MGAKAPFLLCGVIRGNIMGGAIKGVTNAASGILGGIGANSASKEYKKANDRQQNLQEQMYQQQIAFGKPYREVGESALPRLQNLAGIPIDRNKLLGDYFNSQEFKLLNDQARYSGLASAEATGGLGSTATGNMLASIAPQLGQQYLSMKTAEQQDMYNQLMGLTNVGLTAAGMGSAASANNSNVLTSLIGESGQIRGAQKALPWQTAASANSSLGNGASQDVNSFTNMFGGFLGGLF
ncbi:TPA: DNA transfer protein [Escherichia coli]|nr:DNA transfer protein [Escherichia coli]EKO1040134.1 DNA transfer protein [Escherichia coli]MBW9933656.1 DNA transfer protein [Escherichia coli]MCN2835189.1 DNA transfer protein [Escherichia coli]HAZ3892146.1 DNA transfer protein [Escherichia coli]